MGRRKGIDALAVAVTGALADDKLCLDNLTWTLLGRKCRLATFGLSVFNVTLVVHEAAETLHHLEDGLGIARLGCIARAL